MAGLHDARMSKTRRGIRSRPHHPLQPRRSRIGRADRVRQPSPPVQEGPSEQDRRQLLRRHERQRIIEYRFPHGIRANVAAGDNPVNVEHARLMASGELMESTGHTESGTSSDYVDPRFPPPPPDPEPQPGDVRIGEECPEPEGRVGMPGWVRRTDSLRTSGRKRPAEPEWVWDSGDPPPF